MKKLLSILLLAALIIGCKTTANKESGTTSSVSSTEEDLKYYFKGTGNEPFWGIKIGNEEIVFTSLIPGKEKIIFPSKDAVIFSNSALKNADGIAKITTSAN